MDRLEAERILSEVFGFGNFYDSQWKAISYLLKGERVLLIEKTGYGKSLCFQFPGYMFEGLTVVFSPLIALMRDQLKKLNELGIPAKCINSEQTDEENYQVINEAKEGKLKLLYIAHERQENTTWIEATKDLKISMIVVDEAHCISVWCHDFRPAFRRIINLVRLLPDHIPVLATTATATKRVQEDIVSQIGNKIKVIRGNLMRENLKLFVIKVNNEDEKLIWLGKNISKFKGSGIVYTGTRVETELYENWLNTLNIPVTSYNAGLDTEQRINIEKGFIENNWKCIISTNALGMGIDKPDIRFIFHTQIPQSPIHYYQEIGRAGRDGEISYIILLYCNDDKDLPESFIENARPSIKKYYKVIELIKSELLGEKDIVMRANLKQNQFRVIKSDLLEQGIIREVIFGRSKKFEFVSNSKELNIELFEEIKRLKTADLESMLEYAETSDSRMKFLCEFLGDESSSSYQNCDNTGEKKLKIKIDDEWMEKIKEFRQSVFPVLDVETRNSNISNGIAASFYGVSNVGSTIHNCKYNNGGDFPDFLVDITERAVRQTFDINEFDIILHVPPTKSGYLVKNFAEKLSRKLMILCSNNLIKIKETSEQKVFENYYSKNENVKDAFGLINSNEIINKSVLLIDDIYDSGATLKEIGRILTKQGARKITPIVIAKTVGGDLS